MLLNFQEEVRKFYKHYYEENDDAHTIVHADNVCNLALNLNNNIDIKLIILASYIHDIFNENRKIHHELAYKYVLSTQDKFLKKLSSKELKLVAHAVLEHRASFKGEFYSILSEIISSADRGIPSLKNITIRSMQFNKAKADKASKHIIEKYGVNGYAKYPEIYKHYFKDELTKFQQLANNITPIQVLDFWNSR